MIAVVMLLLSDEGEAHLISRSPVNLLLPATWSSATPSTQLYHIYFSTSEFCTSDLTKCALVPSSRYNNKTCDSALALLTLESGL